MIAPTQIIEAARQACETFFAGEMKTKRRLPQDMTDLRSLIRDYDAQRQKEITHEAQ